MFKEAVLCLLFLFPADRPSGRNSRRTGPDPPYLFKPIVPVPRPFATSAALRFKFLPIRFQTAIRREFRRGEPPVPTLMKIHLVTYATPRFRLRQLILGMSARWNGVCDTVTHWTPCLLRTSGFSSSIPDISLAERGSGFWAWKPFIIDAKLLEIPEGDLVFYCDVGRRFPYKILDRPLAPFLEWMEHNQQDFMPGLSIAWRGPLAVWTKRDAFVLTGMDHPSAHTAPSVQASFSLWRAGPASQSFLRQWMNWCSDRRLISDDPSTCGLPEYSEFHEHRHDQSLLTLTCLKTAAKALKIGDVPLPVDTRDPAQVIGYHFNIGPIPPSRSWKPFLAGVRLLERVEMLLRKTVKFGAAMPEHPLAND